MDVILHEYLPPESPLGLTTKVGSKKRKVAVGDGVNEAVTVGDGVRVSVGVGGIKIAVWLAAMAAVCAMITSSSPGANVGTGVLTDGKSKGAQANVMTINSIRSELRILFFIIYLFLSENCISEKNYPFVFNRARWPTAQRWQYRGDRT